MIVVRDIFRLKFGASKEANPLWKEVAGMLRKSGMCRDVRLLTDLVGPHYYAIVLETTYDSLAKWDALEPGLRGNAQWMDVYKKIIALTEDGKREILRTLD